MDEFQHKKMLCFDIETVLDIELAKRFLNLNSSTSNEEVENELLRYHLSITDGKNSFFRQPFWQVACVSYLECTISNDDGYESYAVTNIASAGSETSSERDIILALFNYLNKTKPRLVSFNGRSFDLPVLKYRSMAYKIAAPWLYRSGSKWSNYSNRYSSEWHCDLLEVFSDYGASARIKMSEICALLGIPCKLDVDGSMVSQLYKQNDIKKIRQYCEQDCLATFVLYLYYALHQSRITQLGFDKSIESLENHIAKQKSLNVDVSHIEEFFNGIQNIK